MRKALHNPKLSVDEIKEFESHVKINVKRAYFTALGFIGSHDLAVELSQEAFIRAYKNFDKFDRTKNFFTWYYRILKNLCLNYIRNSRRWQKVDFIEIADTLTNENNPESEFENIELKKKLEDALLELDNEEREVINLYEFQELSYKGIAELLEVPIGTVMSRLYYARKKLAKLLKDFA